MIDGGFLFVEADVLGMRIIRVGRGLTMDDVSRVAAIAASRLSLIEREKIAPSREEVIRIAAALSWPADAIDALIRPLDDGRVHNK
jgi:transcriptional regulator with XRE-family HTH domain